MYLAFKLQMQELSLKETIAYLLLTQNLQVLRSFQSLDQTLEQVLMPTSDICGSMSSSSLVVRVS